MKDKKMKEHFNDDGETATAPAPQPDPNGPIWPPIWMPPTQPGGPVQPDPLVWPHSIPRI